MLEDLKPHLIDLRKRLVTSAFALIVAFAICFSFNEAILGWMLEPLIKVLPQGSKPVFLQVGEAFLTAIKVSFFAALILSLPIIFWQIWLFVAPGLYSNEKKLILPFVLFGTIMFLIGALFAYYIVFPLGLDYLINFGNSKDFVATPSIGYYTGFFAKVMIGFGIAFELPVVCYFLAINGISVKNEYEFFDIASTLEIGKRATIRVLRGNIIMEFSFMPLKRERGFDESGTLLDFFGIVVDERLFVIRAPIDSIFKKGDRILRLNQIIVSNKVELNSAIWRVLLSKKNFSFLLTRKDFEFFITFKNGVK